MQHYISSDHFTTFFKIESFTWFMPLYAGLLMAMTAFHTSYAVSMLANAVAMACLLRVLPVLCMSQGRPGFLA